MIEYRLVNNIDEIKDIPGLLFLLKTEEGYKAGNYIIEDPEAAGREYLEKVYNRVKGVPLEIAKTKHLTLRELTKDDADKLLAIYKKPGVSKFLEDAVPEPEAFSDMLDGYRINYEFFDCGMWGVFENKTGRLIGECGVKYSSIDGKDCYELGFALDDDFTGKGYAYEAASASLKYCFTLELTDEIFAKVRKNNERSVRLLKKLVIIY